MSEVRLGVEDEIVFAEIAHASDLHVREAVPPDAHVPLDLDVQHHVLDEHLRGADRAVRLAVIRRGVDPDLP
eukprot:30802-Pelagococcus_subviridis.AAC.3